MATSKVNELREDIEELNLLLKQAKRKKVQDLLSLEIRKIETEIAAMNAVETKGETPMEVTPTATTSSQKRYQIKLNGYGWDQSDKFVKVFVTLKDAHLVPKEQVYCNLTERSMELHVKNLDNKDYTLSIKKLLEDIKIEDSYWKQKTDMVVIYLAKAVQTKWSHMTEVDKKTEDERNNKFKPDMSKKDPQESIMTLMKNMYETGDDELKRTIAKAWYEGQHGAKKNTLDL